MKHLKLKSSFFFPISPFFPPESLTCFALAHTDPKRVAVSVGRGLQVQGIDGVQVHLVSDQSAPCSPDVDAVLSETRSVGAPQLLDLIGLTGREKIPASVREHSRFPAPLNCTSLLRT
ncbi:hypothetical protein AMECASPLE_010760 [Ameca splendens]|uniref:Uncharacterized protein n=1 Tax=Ameca splendens TaxID=208324 RepID=A0ABV0YMN2_9TELE